MFVEGEQVKLKALKKSRTTFTVLQNLGDMCWIRTNDLKDFRVLIPQYRLVRASGRMIKVCIRRSEKTGKPIKFLIKII